MSRQDQSTPEEGGVQLPPGLPPLADLWRRLVARIIDFLIVGIPLTVIYWFAVGGYDNPGALALSWWQSAMYFIIYFVYDGAMLAARGQTLGKMAVRVRIAALDTGGLPGRPAAWSRAAAYSLPWLVPACGALFWLVNVMWVLWDPNRQALHDKIAETVVVAV